ncbi:hypothetical protein [Actinophytocola sp. KF-1]
MPVRADRPLLRRLEEVAKTAATDAVAEPITAACEYMKSGRTNRLRGGQRLVTLLAAARQRAADEGEWDVVRGLLDAFDHATGRVPAPEENDDGLAELWQAIAAPDADVAELRRVLSARPWIFGGRWVDDADRRLLLPDSESDLLLIRGDGSVHIVAIHPAMGLPGLIKRDRGGWSLMPEVRDAVGQAESYLVSLDENRDWVRERFGVDTRRAGATVLIGHPAVQPHIPEEQVNEVLSRFNAQRTRIAVLTYKALADSAERSLSF